jgi:hypothetical protein
MFADLGEIFGSFAPIDRISDFSGLKWRSGHTIFTPWVSPTPQQDHSNWEDKMSEFPTCQNAEQLGARIMRASEDKRLLLQPEFNRLLSKLKAAGVRVPAHLRELDEELHDEMVEAQFDNMPV